MSDITQELRELLLIIVRWSHAVAAVALVGGSGVGLVTLGSGANGAEQPAGRFEARFQRAFSEIVTLSLIVFLASGVLLTFERLASGAASSLYVSLLGLKLLLSVLLYRWAFSLRRSHSWGGRTARLLVGFGLLVILLATTLKTLYEAGLRS